MFKQEELDRITVDRITSFIASGLTKDGRTVDIEFCELDNSEINLCMDKTEALDFGNVISTVVGPKKATVQFEYKTIRYIYGEKVKEE